MTLRHGVAIGVLWVGLLCGGGGFLNGDAAAYAAQGWAGDLWSRPVHVLWCGLAVALAPLVAEGLPRALDAAAALSGAALLAGSGARSGGALLATAFVLPWCAFGEVDLLWMALVMGAARVGPSWAAALLFLLASTASPTALLALPWACRHRGDLAPLVGALLGVVALTVGSGGAWWVGHRGVLHSELLIGRTLEAWGASGAWLVVAIAVWAGERRVLWLAPLLLAPPDVPGWAFVGVVASAAPVELPWSRTWSVGIGVVAVMAGLTSLKVRVERVRFDDEVLRAVATEHRDGTGYEGPWSWGTRLSVIATGKVDGLPFRPARPLADGRWPTPDVSEVGLLPPGRPPEPGMELLAVDDRGVHWVEPWWTPTR